MAFGNQSEHNDAPMSDINMTPLVDVMLVLLIIFIITVPVLTHAVKVDLPTADSERNVIQPQSITLTVTGNAAIHWNESEVTPAELDVRLLTVATQTPQPAIQLRGDKAVAYEHIVKVMVAVQRAGISTLDFVTDPVVTDTKNQ